jgi:hypothetical protein
MRSPPCTHAVFWGPLRGRAHLPPQDLEAEALAFELARKEEEEAQLSDPFATPARP